VKSSRGRYDSSHLLVHLIFHKAQLQAPKRHFVAVTSIISLATAEESLALSYLQVAVGFY